MSNSYKSSVLNVASIVLLTRMYVGAATQIFAIPDFLDKSLVVFCAILCAIQISVRKYNKLEFIGLFFFGIIIVISAILSKEYTFLYTFMLVLLIGKNSVKSFLSYYFRYCAALLISINIIYVAGLALGMVELSIKNGQNCFTGGFATGNAYAFIVFWLVSLYLYIHFDDCKIGHIIGFTVLSFLISYISLCKTVMVLSIINGIAITLLKNGWYPKKILEFLARWLFPVLGVAYCSAITIFANKMGSNYAAVFAIDHFLTGRIRNAAYYYEKFGFTFWGREISKGAISYDDYYRLTSVTIDGLYPLLFLQVGFCMFILLCLAFVLVKKNKEVGRVELYFLIVYVIFGLSEMFVANGIICFPLLIFAGILFNKNNYLKIESELRL